MLLASSCLFSSSRFLSAFSSSVSSFSGSAGCSSRAGAGDGGPEDCVAVAAGDDAACFSLFRPPITPSLWALVDDSASGGGDDGGEACLALPLPPMTPIPRGFDWSLLDDSGFGDAGGEACFSAFLPPIIPILRGFV